MPRRVVVAERRTDIDLGASNRELFERLFGEPARSVGLAVTRLGVTPVPDQLVSIERLGSRWWISAEALADPCRVDDQHVAPEWVLDRLGRLHAAGVRPHYLRVLHEVPDPAWSPSQPPPVLVPAARSHRTADAALLAGIRASLAGAAAMTRGLASAAAAVATAPVVLLGDPILLGGRQIGGDRVLWGELTRWTWT